MFISSHEVLGLPTKGFRDASNGGGQPFGEAGGLLPELLRGLPGGSRQTFGQSGLLDGLPLLLGQGLLLLIGLGGGRATQWQQRGLTVVMISDTHNDHRQLTVPPGDILIHAGDWTRFGKREHAVITWQFNTNNLSHRAVELSNLLL